MVGEEEVARRLQQILDLHSEVTDRVYQGHQTNWIPVIVCRSCRRPHPCDTWRVANAALKGTPA